MGGEGGGVGGGEGMCPFPVSTVSLSCRLLSFFAFWGIFSHSFYLYFFPLFAFLQVTELVQFLLVKDQKKIPIKRVGEFRCSLFPRDLFLTESSPLPAGRDVSHLPAEPYGVPPPPSPPNLYGMASFSSKPYRIAPTLLFSTDILKKVIREYKDVYSEIVNRAGRTLQQV